MALSSIVLVSLLAQADLSADAGVSAAVTPPPVAVPAATPTAPVDSAERAAAAAERSAAAAERLVQALERISPAPAATAGAKAAVPTDVVWTTQAGLGLIALSGNASSVTMNGTANVERKSEAFIFTGKMNGKYGQSDPQDATKPTEVLAMALALEARADKRFTERYSGYVALGGDTDHVKSVELRGFGEGGLGIIWVEEKRSEVPDQRSATFFRTDVAFRYLEESRFQYYPTPENIPDVTLIAPRFGVLFRHELSDGVKFSEEIEALPNIIGPSRLLVNSTTKLSAAVYDGIAVGVSLVVNHDSRPAALKVPTDTALSVGLEISL